MKDGPLQSATVNNARGPRRAFDFAAVGLSVACLIHCLALPVLVAVAPWLPLALVSDERVHLAFVLAAIPISAFAFLRRGGHPISAPSLILAMAGLATLALGALSVPDVLETAVTVLGALLLAAAHLTRLRRSVAS